MNMGQTMITTGMFVLLVMSVISANRMLIQSTESTLQAEALEISAAIAEDLIAEASEKKFDANANDLGDQGYWVFGACGREALEDQRVGPLPDKLDTTKTPPAFNSADAFDDFDDYHNYSRIVDAGGINGFLVRSDVYYVDPQNPDVQIFWTSYYKKMEVRVSHPAYIVNDTTGTSFNSDGSPAGIVYSTLISY